MRGRRLLDQRGAIEIVEQHRRGVERVDDVEDRQRRHGRARGGEILRVALLVLGFTLCRPKRRRPDANHEPARPDLHFKTRRPGAGPGDPL